MSNVNVNAQDRSPDFVLMRLVSAAEYDDLEPDREEVLSPHQRPEKSAGGGGGGGREEPNYSADTQTCQWIPVLRLSTDEEPQELQEGLCHRHVHMKEHSIVDKPGHFAPNDSLKPGTGTSTLDPVLNLARQLGEIGPSSDATRKDEGDVSVCSCQPGEDPSETSDALLVLEGLGTSQVGHKGEKDQMSFAQTLSDSASLSGLMRQLTSDPCHQDAAGPSAPPSRPPTPKHVGSALRLSACGGGGSGEKEKDRGKSRKGSLKVCLSKLFRTKSTGSTDGGHLTDKRPSLASSTSSGGSLVEVFGPGDLDTSRSGHAPL